MTGFAHELTELFRSTEDTEEHLECLRGDFGDLGAEGTAHQAKQAEKMLQGFMGATEDINLTLYTALGCAHSLVVEARERAESYAGADSRQ